MFIILFFICSCEISSGVVENRKLIKGIKKSKVLFNQSFKMTSGDTAVCVVLLDRFKWCDTDMKHGTLGDGTL